MAVLRGDEAPHEGLPTLRAWVARLFEKSWGGKAVNPEIGEVVLNERSVRDALGHRPMPAKNAAFLAVKAVLERGALVSSAKHGDTNSFYISAPVKIGATDNIVTVLAPMACSHEIG